MVEKSQKIDGIDVAECQKLWCRDLENGKTMGNGNAAASGYRATTEPVQLCDASNTCIYCWGERKWCAGEVTGEWNPQFGAYTRGGNDSATYHSVQKGNCFAWRLGRANCPDGKTAFLDGDEWVCADSAPSADSARKSAVRRTGSIRRVIR